MDIGFDFSFLSTKQHSPSLYHGIGTRERLQGVQPGITMCRSITIETVFFLSPNIRGALLTEAISDAAIILMQVLNSKIMTQSHGGM